MKQLYDRKYLVLPNYEPFLDLNVVSVKKIYTSDECVIDEDESC